MKEFLITNSEFIIFITFLSITEIFITSFGFLTKSFDTLRHNEKSILKQVSLAKQEECLFIEANLDYAINKKNSMFFEVVDHDNFTEPTVSTKHPTTTT